MKAFTNTILSFVFYTESSSQTLTTFISHHSLDSKGGLAWWQPSLSWVSLKHYGWPSFQLHLKMSSVFAVLLDYPVNRLAKTPFSGTEIIKCPRCSWQQWLCCQQPQRQLCAFLICCTCLLGLAGPCSQRSTNYPSIRSNFPRHQESQRLGPSRARSYYSAQFHSRQSRAVAEWHSPFL